MRLRFVIEQKAGEQKFNVIAIIEFQNFEDGIRKAIKEAMLETFGEMFETETMNAEVTEKNKITTIKISTENSSKVNLLNKKLVELLRREQQADSMKLKIQKFNLN